MSDKGMRPRSRAFKEIGRTHPRGGRSRTAKLRDVGWFRCIDVKNAAMMPATPRFKLTTICNQMNPSLLIAFGLIMGIALGLATADFTHFIDFSDSAKAFVGGLLGAAMTVFAAFLVAERQERSRRTELAEARKRQQLGARAVLASDLSRIIEYAEKSAQVAIEAGQAVEARQTIEDIVCPSLTLDILTRLQRLVELTDGADADQIVDLMHCYQVQHARLSGILNDFTRPRKHRGVTVIITEASFHFTAHATVELYLRAEVMFSFARGEAASISPPPFPDERISTALRQLQFDAWLPDYEQGSVMRTMTTMTAEGRWRTCQGPQQDDAE